MKYNNYDIIKIYYSGYTVTSAYSCGGYQVFIGDTPLHKNLYYSGGYSGQTITGDIDCNSSTTITLAETTAEQPDPNECFYRYAILGDCVTTIGEKAFSGETCLMSIYMPEGLETIGNSAFTDCNYLRITNNVNMEDDTWYYETRFPDSIKTIGNYAFAGCGGINGGDVIDPEYLHLPSELTSIGNYAFSGNHIVWLEIPSKVASIGNFAFKDGINLKKVYIPTSVTSIGTGAFQNCSGLTSITINKLTPPSLGLTSQVRYTFEGSTCPIYVPASRVDTYKAADGWSYYASRIQAIQT